MESCELYTGIFDSDKDKFTIDCGMVKGIVERFRRIDEATGEEYALCYLEVMGNKIHETETFAKNREDGLETVVTMIVEMNKTITDSLKRAEENYFVDKALAPL